MTRIRARLIQLQEIPDSRRGTLCVAEGEGTVPFAIRRVFYSYDMPAGSERGHHAHRAQHQFAVAMHGILEATAVAREGTESFILDRPGIGLHVPPMTWLAIRARSAGAVLMVFASEHYDDADYIRDRTEFDRLIASH